MSIRYVEGDATRPLGDDACIVAHICNDFGGWGRGFVLAISNRWPQPEREYRRWSKEGTNAATPFELSQIQMVLVDNNFWVANMVAQHGIGRHHGRPPIRYDAVADCLRLLAQEALRLDASIHMPRIGCGLAGGEWSLIEPIIQQELISQDIPVTIYDFG